MAMSIDGIGAMTSALSTSVAQMAAVAHNVANIQTTKPVSDAAFQGEQVVTAEREGGGVEIGTVAPAGTPEGHLVFEPDNPQADDRGLVKLPDIDIGQQMVELLVAQDVVKANVKGIGQAIDTYRDLLAVTDRQRNDLAASGS
jgi:flagellar basal-body rod protein FlgC